MSRSHAAVVALIGIATAAFAATANAQVYEVVCISNQTRNPVEYYIKFGSDRYQKSRLAADKFWPYVQNASKVRPVTLWYNADLRRGRQSAKEIPLRTRAVPDTVDRCDARFRYTFILDQNDLNTLILYDNGQ